MVKFSMRRLLANRSGNFMIEFAIVLPVLFMLVAGLLDLGRFGWQKSATLQGAREGAQYGTLAGQVTGGFPLSSADSAAVNTTAQNASGISGVTATNTGFCECTAGTAVSCTSTCTGNTSPKKYLTVTTTAPFTSVLSVATLHFAFGSWTPPTSMTSSITLMVP